MIEDMRDVTAEILKGVSDKLNGFARYERLATNRKALIAACEGQPNRRCDVGAYYGAPPTISSRSSKSRTCALSMRPRSASVTFGGETDNWMWPRHTGDFGFYRAYVAPDGSSRPYARDNVPYRAKNWLRIAAEGARMDILLNFTCGAVSWTRAWPHFLARLGSCGAGFLAFWEDLLTMVHSGGATVR
ncbi:S46 family peptidase [Mesorhizobium sp. M1403]|uniref:S46 family peptidase n=1 Tax=Mesorhizobium sp. M1403 TaxID=2957097 RepID=UPI00333A737F